MIFELAQDFHDAVTAMPREHPKHRTLELLEEAVRRDIHFIARHPTTLFQCMWNTCWWYDCPEAAKHYVGRYSPRSDMGLKCFEFLDNWLGLKENQTPGFFWLRAIRPPPVHLGTAQLAVLHGHEDSVNGVAYSPDGTQIASVSSRAVIIWDVTCGRKVAVLRGHESDISGVVFSPDGMRIATGSSDRTVCVWDVATGEKLLVSRRCTIIVCSPGQNGPPRRVQSTGGTAIGLRSPSSEVHFLPTCCTLAAIT